MPKKSSKKSAPTGNEDVLEYIELCAEGALTADGFDDAILGVVETFEPGGRITRALYDRAKMIKIMQTRDGMTREEAEEFFEFNIADAYMDHGPSFAVLFPRRATPK